MSEVKIERRRIGGQSAPSLEQKIAACLGDEKAVSDEVEALRYAVEGELPHAQQAVEQARQRSLDPLTNKEEALRAVQLAELTVQRLQHALPLLEQKHRQCLSEEYHSLWVSRHFAARQQRDQQSEKFGRLRELQAEMLAILQETAEVDKLVDAANSDGPANEPRRLLSVELHARGLENYTRDNPSLIKSMVLLDFDSGKQVWPPPQTSVAAAYASGSTDFRKHPDEFGPNWFVARDAEEARLRRQQQAEEASEQVRREQERDAYHRSLWERSRPWKTV
jgi:hypothetical protein